MVDSAREAETRAADIEAQAEVPDLVDSEPTAAETDEPADQTGSADASDKTSPAADEDASPAAAVNALPTRSMSLRTIGEKYDDERALEAYKR